MSIVGALTIAASSPTSGAPAQQGNLLVLIVPYALIFIVFYFLMIRPTRQRQKEHENSDHDENRNDRREYRN